MPGEEKLQVYFPHLEDTVEVLQVQRVLERMNVFLRLMHEGLTTAEREQRTINANHEFAKSRRVVPQITEKLCSAFPIRAEQLKGTTCELATLPAVARQATVLATDDLPLQVWLKNRSVTLVGFRIDRRGRLVGEAWISKAGLDAGEFQLYVRTVARECNRFEYILTGR